MGAIYVICGIICLCGLFFLLGIAWHMSFNTTNDDIVGNLIKEDELMYMQFNPDVVEKLRDGEVIKVKFLIHRE